MSENKYKDLLKNPVFQHFNRISQIPRCSGQEEKIADYLESLAKKHSLTWQRDLENNLIIKRKTSSDQTVILQSHVDMVCIKNDSSSHNFQQEPNQLTIDQDRLTAINTTLGADNGIGVAYMLTLLTDPEYEGPNLECIFTTNEEEGMSGAVNIDLSELNGNMMINLDSEDAGTIITSCAGGVQVNYELDLEYKRKEGLVYELEISGLIGGHSGLDINKNRGNALILMGRSLNYLLEKGVDFRIIEISGGEKHNSIPVKAKSAILVSSRTEGKKVGEAIPIIEEVFQREAADSDPGIQISCKLSGDGDYKVYSKASTMKVVGLLTLIPNGVIEYTNQNTAEVQTSLNLALLKKNDHKLAIISSLRSNNDTSLEKLIARCQLLKRAFNVAMTTESYYNPWPHKADSILRNLAARVYQETFKEEVKIKSIHAGLECGLFLAKKNSLDIISIGPQTYNIHTPDESVSISSVNDTFNYLKNILKAIDKEASK